MENRTAASSTRLLVSHSCRNPDNSHRVNRLGKTTAFFVPILVLQHLLKYPKPQIPKPPQRPVALVVTPLIELGKAHVSPSIQYKCNT